MVGFPCCCRTCTIYKDTFNRPDKDRLDLPWLNEGVEFNIVDFAARPDSSGATAILDVQHPVPDESMHVVMTIKDEVPNGGIRYRIMLNVVKASNINSFFFADFLRNGTADSIIKLGISSNGVETILAQDIVLGLVDLTRNFEALISDTEFCAKVTNATLSYVGVTPPPLFEDGYYSGMFANSDAAVIDQFEFKEHFQTNEDCGHCLCKCEDQILPPMLTVTIYPDPANCERLNLLPECTFPIYWNRIDSRWEGEGFCCEGYVNTGQNWRVAVSCPTGEGTGELTADTMVMTILQGCTNSCGGCIGGQLPISSSCYPFELVYGPFYVAPTDLTCLCTTNTNIFERGSCNYYIKIT